MYLRRAHIILIQLLPWALDCVGFDLSSKGVSISVDTSSGSYQIATRTTPAVHFEGLQHRLTKDHQVYSSGSGSMHVSSSSSFNGSDGMGNFTGVTLEWSLSHAPSENGVVYRTAFRAYDWAIVFRQEFPSGLNGSRGHSFVAEFPALSWNTTNPSAGWVSWNGGMSGSHVEAGQWPTSDFGAKDGGPVVVFPKPSQRGNARGNEQWSLVISGASQFMAGGVGPCETANLSLCSGLRGSYDYIPNGFTFETVLSVGDRAGVVDGMYRWGNLLLAKFGKQRVMPWEAQSYYITKLGYSSTAWFHYCPAPTEGKYDPDNGNYESGLLEAHELLMAQGVPYHYGWIDSWWYGERLHHGVSLWEDLTTKPPDFSDMNNRFPDGLTGMVKKTGRKVVAHIGEWSAETPYGKNASNGFVNRGSHSLPTNQAFWDELMRKARDWGLLVMKQDHINENIEGYDDNVTILGDWLAAQAQASYDNGIPIMYCMDQPWFLTNALQLPLKGHPAREVLTRAGPDYLPGSNRGQWAIGASSILSWALSVFPYKDTFYSNSSAHNPQKGCPFYGFKEEHPMTHAVAAALSAGPVTFSDGPGYANKSLVMQTCREDGVLLKPDRPAMSIEATWARQAFGGNGPDGEVLATYATIPSCATTESLASWHYIFANMLSSDYNLTLADLFLAGGELYVAWLYNSAEVFRFDANHFLDLKAGKDYGDMRLWRLSPVLPGGWSLLGERSKFVGVARQRFKCFDFSYNSIHATLLGAPHEKLTLLLASPNLDIVTVHCTLSGDGKAQWIFRVEDGTSSCGETLGVVV